MEREYSGLGKTVEYAHGCNHRDRGRSLCRSDERRYQERDRKNHNRTDAFGELCYLVGDAALADSRTKRAASSRDEDDYAATGQRRPDSF